MIAEHRMSMYGLLMKTVPGFQFLISTAASVLLAVALSMPVSAATETADQREPVTTSDPSIPTDELSLLLIPLSKEELLIEADGWQEIVKSTALKIARAEIAVRRENKEIDKAKEFMKKTEAAKAQLQEVAEKVEEAKATGDAEKIAEAREAAADARKITQEIDAIVDESVEAARKTAEMQRELSDVAGQSLDETAEAARNAKQAVTDIQKTIDSAEGKSREGVTEIHQRVLDKTTEALSASEELGEKIDEMLIDATAAAKEVAALDDVATAIDQAEEVKEAEKIDLLKKVTMLREERTLLLDKMRAVIDELERKTDKDDADTHARIKDYQNYISSVSGIHVDVTDTTSAWVSVKGWVISKEGGIRWLVNIGGFLGILVLAWFLARFLSRMTDKAMSQVTFPKLLEGFLVGSVRWVVMIIGIIWALSVLEVSVGPLLALVGAAGFILAFAMQDSLSNFASGLMILFFRPFDTGDVVDAGGVSGTVRTMNLVSTTIRTFDNKLMVVPNSKIWSDVITNVTGVTERRIDMEFGIGYEDDIDQAQAILEEIVADHPKVLETPEPIIRMSALADSSVNFICRPWSTPSDYWDVYWDITRMVKKRFDEVGIGIPFPQRDVHLYIEKADKNTVDTLQAGLPKKTAQGERSADEQMDGGLDT
jgi:small conductance mechanosensitive channel